MLLRLGCVISQDLFNTYSEVIMAEISEKNGGSIGRKNVNNMSFADYTVLIAELEDKLQELVQTVALAGASWLIGFVLEKAHSGDCQ